MGREREGHDGGRNKGVKDMGRLREHGGGRKKGVKDMENGTGA